MSERRDLFGEAPSLESAQERACAAAKRYRQRHPERVREATKRYRLSGAGSEMTKRAGASYRAKNRERIRQRKQREYEADPVGAKARAAKVRERIKGDATLKERANAYARRRHQIRRQKLIIEIAGRPQPDTCDVCGQGGRIYVDHCHETGVFRGFLCRGCNLILGHAKDSPSLLRKLAEYLAVDRRRARRLRYNSSGRIALAKETQENGFGLRR